MRSSFLLLFFNKIAYIAVHFHFRIASMIADFLVYKRSDKDYVRKDIEPEHEDYYGSKGAVNGGIFYGICYEPGKKSADKGKNKRTENRPGKNVYPIGASPCAAVINCI